MGFLTTLDRSLGDGMRARIGSAPVAGPVARVASVLLAPAFELLVVAMITEPSTRSAGVRAGAAAAAGASAARGMRDAIGRPRPGARGDAGFPSRHAAAAAAIVGSIRRSHPPAAGGLAAIAALGLVGRVITADHDPADIVAGVGVGLVTEHILNALIVRVATG